MAYRLRKALAAAPANVIQLEEFPSRRFCELYFARHVWGHHSTRCTEWFPTTEGFWEAISDDGRVRGIIDEIPDEEPEF